jgi:hypothetical protein
MKRPNATTTVHDSPTRRSPSKVNKLKPSIKENETRIKIIIPTVLISAVITLILIWVLRETTLINGNEITARYEQLSQLKSLIRLQTEVLDQLLSSLNKEDRGDDEEQEEVVGQKLIHTNENSHTIWMVTKVVDIRAIKARELLYDEQNKAIFDDFLNGVYKDINVLINSRSAQEENANGEEDTKKTEQVESLGAVKDSAAKIKAQIISILGEAFFTNSNIQLRRSSTSERENGDDESSEAGAETHQSIEDDEELEKPVTTKKSLSKKKGSKAKMSKTIKAKKSEESDDSDSSAGTTTRKGTKDDEDD